MVMSPFRVTLNLFHNEKRIISKEGIHFHKWITDHCETLTGLAGWILYDAGILTNFSELVLLFELANITMYIDFRLRFNRMHRLRTTTNSDKFVKTHESV